jgi:hypothetical protein
MKQHTWPSRYKTMRALQCMQPKARARVCDALLMMLQLQLWPEGAAQSSVLFVSPFAQRSSQLSS